MPGDFSRRIRDLADAVGDGKLVGRIVVDQVYAAVQHNDLTYRHPRGGGPMYLSGPLMDKYRGYMRDLAESVHRPGELPRTMADAMEDMTGEVYSHAPIEFHDLRRSAAPSVEDNGAIVYSRPAEVPRLTAAQLRQKSRARSQGHVPG
ncbi:hypothetical protein ACIBSV_46750 [Embleya sp. NPDC050154]|uniref:hypothetical protein n=1 Tax=Embleya sp. NPDC050154 TaxID=3363988 RepID=UPI0037ACC5AB